MSRARSGPEIFSPFHRDTLAHPARLFSSFLLPEVFSDFFLLQLIIWLISVKLSKRNNSLIKKHNIFLLQFSLSLHWTWFTFSVCWSKKFVKFVSAQMCQICLHQFQDHGNPRKTRVSYITHGRVWYSGQKFDSEVFIQFWMQNSILKEWWDVILFGCVIFRTVFSDFSPVVKTVLSKKKKKRILNDWHTSKIMFHNLFYERAHAQVDVWKHVGFVTSEKQSIENGIFPQLNFHIRISWGAIQGLYNIKLFHLWKVKHIFLLCGPFNDAHHWVKICACKKNAKKQFEKH